MKKKIVLGTSLVIFFFTLLFLYFKSNFNKDIIAKKKKVDFVEKKNIQLNEEIIESSNIIEDVSYSAKDAKGNEYYLKAGEGTIDQNDSNFIRLWQIQYK